MHQYGNFWLITFFFLDRRCLKLQDNLIPGLIKAPSTINSTPNSIPVSSQRGKEGTGGGHPSPSWQHQRSCRDFIHRWLGNRPATVCGSQAKCIWQSWSFEPLCSDNMTPNNKKKTSDLTFSSSGQNKHIIKAVFGFHLSSI